MVAILAGNEFPPELPRLFDHVVRTRHLAIAAVAAGMLDARLVQILPTVGVWIVFPPDRHDATLGERTMMAIASAISPPIASDTNIDLPRALHVAGLDGMLMGIDGDDPVLREIDAARTILGEAAMIYLGNFVSHLLARMLDEGFFTMPPDQVDQSGNIAPLIKGLLGSTPLMIEVSLLRRELEFMLNRRTH